MWLQQWAKETDFADWFWTRFRTYDLLPDYGHAVIAHWNDILWGSVPTFPFILWWFIGSPPTGLVIAVFAWVFLVAGYYTWREDHLLLAPKLVLRFENRAPFIQPTPTRQQPYAGPEVAGPNRIYVRVFPECSTRVNDCEPYLLAVYAEHNGAWVATPLNEPFLLTWANHPGVRQMNVEPVIGPYVDVFYIEAGKDQIIPCIPDAVRPLRIQNAFSRLQTYRFDVRVTNGDPISLRVSTGPDWDQPQIHIIEAA